MTLTQPWLLPLGLLVAGALAVVGVRLARRRSAALTAAGFSTGGRRGRAVGVWFSVGGVALLAFAMAGPAAALPVARSAGTVILAMDVSESMKATDVVPTRLAAAQQAAQAFVDAQPASVDVGVVGFDQGALSTAPPGPDRTAATAALANLRPAGGTSLAAAVLGALAAITGRPVAVGENGALPDIGSWTSATIVVFSDGEDTGARGSEGEDALTQAATIAQNAGVRIETVGVGTAEGAAVTVDGYQLHTALDTDRLTGLAEATGGSYHPASDADQLADIASSVDLRLTVSRQDVPLAAAFVAGALALLLVGAVITAVRTGRFV